MSLKQTIDALVAAWNDQDVDTIVSVFAEDGAYHEPAGPDRCGRTHLGHAAIRAALERIFATFPDGRIVPAGPLVIAGDRAHCEWDFEWTGSGGEKRTTRGVDIFTFADGKLRHKSAYLKQHTAS